jgi:uncharacterized FlgJ-related protein
MPAAASTATDTWGCFEPQPGHPTAAEKRSFINEVGSLATRAEQRHGVPAAALVAMAIQETGYGWTRLAQNTNNLLAWSYTSSAAAEGREPWVLDCPGQSSSQRYIVFRDRAEAVDFVAEQLATSVNYQADTERYRQDRANGVDVIEAVNRWVDGIADPYSSQPAPYREAIKRILNNSYNPSDQRSAENNLYRLSEPISPPQPRA